MSDARWKEALLESPWWLPLRVLLAMFYSGLVRIRNFLYDKKFLHIEKLPVRVMSVGNVSVGGTGKTPIVAFLAMAFKARGMDVALVSRGYGGRLKGPAQVDIRKPQAAALFGDEPVWLQKKVVVPVFIGRSRVAAAEALLHRFRQTDLIIADDAFQHRRLYRDVDIVVIDATEKTEQWRQVPWGRARESWSRAVPRAHAVILSKMNLASELQLESVRTQLKSLFLAIGREIPLFEFEYKIQILVTLGGAVMRQPREFKGEKVLLVSGIAKPEQFSLQVRQELHAEVVGEVQMPDHYSFDSIDTVQLQKIEQEARSKGAGAILITEKDAVKLGHWVSSVPVFVTLLEPVPRGSIEALYALSRRPPIL